jgi:hypothetical protein
MRQTIRDEDEVIGPRLLIRACRNSVRVATDFGLNRAVLADLQAGQPARKGNKRGNAYAYNVKSIG